MNTQSIITMQFPGLTEPARLYDSPVIDNQEPGSLGLGIDWKQRTIYIPDCEVGASPSSQLILFHECLSEHQPKTRDLTLAEFLFAAGFILNDLEVYKNEALRFHHTATGMLFPVQVRCRYNVGGLWNVDSSRSEIILLTLSRGYMTYPWNTSEAQNHNHVRLIVKALVE